VQSKQGVSSCHGYHLFSQGAVIRRPTGSHFSSLSFRPPLIAAKRLFTVMPWGFQQLHRNIRADKTVFQWALTFFLNLSGLVASFCKDS
jgi:hypothetical protein